ncbi:MAG: DUF1499 domain-containing protein [Acetobacteraceae bacterium]|nr:DUF1499 domain-containing protein [Acetobacteraceae bacterium]
MRLDRRIVTIVLAVGLTLTAAGLALRMYLDRPAEDRLAPDEVVSIADLHRPSRPSFLACPAGYCAAADMESPIFPMPWDQLREYWKEIAEVAAITVVSEFEHRRAVYIQHSPIFRFPDIVTVEFVALGPERSSVAVYSRSRYRGYDFAENRKRVERWLFQLQEVAHPAVSSHGRWH